METDLLVGIKEHLCMSIADAGDDPGHIQDYLGAAHLRQSRL